ncbi:MAG: HIT family protein [Chlamydiia bacterium]
MSDCIFCKILQRQIPSFPIWENEEFIAILDAFPNTPGMTLILSKQHYGSNPWALPAGMLERAMPAARAVAQILEKGLGVNRVAMVVEGMGVNHFHIKLYPLHGVGEEWVPHLPEERRYQTQYEGYLNTLLGPPRSGEELAAMQKRLVAIAPS